jgi:hypothetical protein
MIDERSSGHLTVRRARLCRKIRVSGQSGPRRRRFALALGHDLPECPSSNGHGFIGRRDGQKFDPPTVVVSLVQELVVSLDGRGRFWREAEMQVDRLSVLLDGRGPCFFDSATHAQKGGAQSVDQAQQSPRYGLMLRWVEF